MIHCSWRFSSGTVSVRRAARTSFLFFFYHCLDGCNVSLDFGSICPYVLGVRLDGLCVLIDGLGVGLDRLNLQSQLGFVGSAPSLGKPLLTFFELVLPLLDLSLGKVPFISWQIFAFVVGDLTRGKLFSIKARHALGDDARGRKGRSHGRNARAQMRGLGG